MKITLTITVDDKEKVYEAAANLEGKPDPITVQWMVDGMLVSAIKSLRVQVVEPKPEPTPPPTAEETALLNKLEGAANAQPN